jgi:hypothetical protein
MQDSFEYEHTPGGRARYRLDGKFIYRDEHDGHSWHSVDKPLDRGSPEIARKDFEDIRRETASQGLLRT